MRKSDDISALAPALVAAQAEMPPIPKTGKNPHFRSKYVPLPDLLSHIRPVFAKHGLALVQTPSMAEQAGMVSICTMIVHKSGQWIEGEFDITADKNTAQGFGSAITYGRRYGAESMAGVSGTDDDDAELAMGRGGKNSNTDKDGRPSASQKPLEEDIISI